MEVCLFIIYFTSMKQSFTYSGEAKTKRDAMRKAKKQGIKNFSDLVEGLLKTYSLAAVEIGMDASVEAYARKVWDLK